MICMQAYLSRAWLESAWLSQEEGVGESVYWGQLERGREEEKQKSNVIGNLENIQRDWLLWNVQSI